jgi:hypothetical protein
METNDELEPNTKRKKSRHKRSKNAKTRKTHAKNKENTIFLDK